MKVSIIGCGLIGRKRALALSSDDILIACCDTNPEAAGKFGKEFNCRSYTDYKQLLEKEDADIIVVAVVNKFAKEIIIESLKRGKHVLAEKPLGRNLSEANEIVSAAKDNGVVLKTGFNHRFHPAIMEARKIIDKGEIGRVFNIRGRYGHGGRAGMEKEWRASKELCGGGELLDQGVHIIDLIRWFGGGIKEVIGKVETKFWDLEVEDNAFGVLKTESGVTASFHVSWTNWKNIFSFEIFGTEGYVKIEGLGGSYGPESLETGIRKKEGGRPDINIINYGPEDISWREEWKEFKSACQSNREPLGSGYDGLKANEVIEALYLSSKQNKAVFLD
ncbi:MAG: Gfo/Idh/MocA family oxidoreductase [Ignavibacteriaceae bacterium]|nr:Gfo/Idh/MocA family oxidoreductase [Ignavibacteriaceae bacterium]